MRSLEELLDLIPRYLSKGLTDEELVEFESALRTYPVLQRETEEFRDLQFGLALSDRYSELHVTPNLISEYAYRRESLSDKERERISEHMDYCRRCREYYDLARKSYDSVTADKTAGRDFVSRVSKLLERFSGFLQTSPRPALAVLLLIILIVPAFWGVQEMIGPSGGISSWNLQSIGTRDSGTPEVVTYEKSDELVRIKIHGVPTLASATYQFSLVDSSDTPVIVVGGLKPDDPIVVEIPASHLFSGRFMMRVDEIMSGQVAPLPVSLKQVFVQISE